MLLFLRKHNSNHSFSTAKNKSQFFNYKFILQIFKITENKCSISNKPKIQIKKQSQQVTLAAPSISNKRKLSYHNSKKTRLKRWQRLHLPSFSTLLPSPLCSLCPELQSNRVALLRDSLLRPQCSPNEIGLVPLYNFIFNPKRTSHYTRPSPPKFSTSHQNNESHNLEASESKTSAPD